MSEECISVGNSLLVERVLSQWIYDIKGTASFKGSYVEDCSIADFGLSLSCKWLSGSHYYWILTTLAP